MWALGGPRGPSVGDQFQFQVSSAFLAGNRPEPGLGGRSGVGGVSLVARLEASIAPTTLPAFGLMALIRVWLALDGEIGSQLVARFRHRRAGSGNRTVPIGTGARRYRFVAAPAVAVEQRQSLGCRCRPRHRSGPGRCARCESPRGYSIYDPTTGDGLSSTATLPTPRRAVAASGPPKGTDKGHGFLRGGETHGVRVSETLSRSNPHAGGRQSSRSATAVRAGVHFELHWCFILIRVASSKCELHGLMGL